MSLTAMTPTGWSGLTKKLKWPLSSPKPGITSISMNVDGRIMVAVKGSVPMCASIRALLSKWPSPTPASTLATEL